MNKITNKIKILLGIVKNQFGKVETDKAEIFFDGDELKVDTKVYNSDGEAIEDGEYTDEEKVYKIVDSVVTFISPKEEEPKEEVVEEKTETTETTEKTEEVKEEMADETIVDEVEEEVKEETIEPAEPTMEDRVSALEEVVEALFEEIRNMKVREVEQVAKNEEIIHEFSAFKNSPTAESITMAKKEEKCFDECGQSTADKLKALRSKK